MKLTALEVQRNHKVKASPPKGEPVPEPLLRLVQISKHFGTLVALQDVSLQVEPGEVIGLVGRRGAGKSMLLQLIGGLHQPTSGALYFDCAAVQLSNPAEAQALGISMVHQLPLLAENLDVIANISLGREIGWLRYIGIPDDVSMARRAMELLAELNAANIVDVKVSNLPDEQRQIVAIARELLLTPDNEIETAIRSRLPEIDELFFEILTQNLQVAQQQGEQQAVMRLQVIGDAAMRAIQGTQPPEVRFVNTLLQIEYPAKTRELLERNKQARVPEFVAWMDGLADELREDGRADTADRLRQVIAQAREVAGLKVAT